VTLARASSNTFAGIRPGDVPAFVAAQLLGAFAAWAFFKWLSPLRRGLRPHPTLEAATEVPHE
jgi:glycerol uptake facilitator-like aquaporin